MITYQEAEKIFLEVLERERAMTLHEIVMMEEWTTEKPIGWFFSYQSKEYKETRDRKFLLIGNGPILVKRMDGEVIIFGSSPRAIERVKRLMKKTMFEVKLEHWWKRTMRRVKEWRSNLRG